MNASEILCRYLHDTSLRYLRISSDGVQWKFALQKRLKLLCESKPNLAMRSLIVVSGQAISPTIALACLFQHPVVGRVVELALEPAQEGAAAHGREVDQLLERMHLPGSFRRRNCGSRTTG